VSGVGELFGRSNQMSDKACAFAMSFGQSSSKVKIIPLTMEKPFHEKNSNSCSSQDSEIPILPEFPNFSLYTT
jgi:hypothetical protein